MNEHHVHSVMVVSLSQHDHADSYVIDLSGAQFGIERPVTPYTEYMEDYGVVIDRIRPVGSYQIDERETEEEKERGGVAINEANKLQKLTLKVAMTGWDAGPENTKISQMLKLPRSKFAEQSEAFIERMGAMLLYGFDSLHESAGALKKFGEYSFPSDWEAHVAAHNKLFGGQQGIKQGQY